MFSSPKRLFDVRIFNKPTFLPGCISTNRESIEASLHHLLPKQPLPENTVVFGRAGPQALPNNSKLIGRLYNY